MPPYMYWPSKYAEFDFDEESAFKNRVSGSDIFYVLSLPPRMARRSRGEPSAYDVTYSGGRMIARPTIAVGEFPAGYLLEVGVFVETFANRERCATCSTLSVARRLPGQRGVERRPGGGVRLTVCPVLRSPVGFPPDIHETEEEGSVHDIGTLPLYHQRVVTKP